MITGVVDRTCAAAMENGWVFCHPDIDRCTILPGVLHSSRISVVRELFNGRRRLSVMMPELWSLACASTVRVFANLEIRSITQTEPYATIHQVNVYLGVQIRWSTPNIRITVLPKMCRYRKASYPVRLGIFEVTSGSRRLASRLDFMLGIVSNSIPVNKMTPIRFVVLVHIILHIPSMIPPHTVLPDLRALRNKFLIT